MTKLKFIIKNTSTYNKGFTLIELLVVISIISLLSSILIAVTNVARAKGRDAYKVGTSRQVAIALQAFNNDKGRMPKNYYNTDGSYNNAGTGNAIAIDDSSGAPTNSGLAYTASMQELVSGGYLTSVPHSPGGQPFAYYNYGSGTEAGAMFATTLESAKATATGAGGSCRPFAATSNFNPAADFNDDGKVDAFDMNILAANWQMPGDHAHGDATGDGFVDSFDLNMVAAAWQTSSNDPTYHNLCSKNISTDYCVCSSY